MAREIFFERLVLSVRIGTGEAERKSPQTLLATGRFRLVDLPWGNDSVGRTVDYEQLVREIVSVSFHSEFCLLERLAEHVADRVMERFSGISSFELTLWKDPSPVPFPVDRIGVTVRIDRVDWEKRRSRPDSPERT